MKSNEIHKAHQLYLCGPSLEKVAKRFNITRQRLHHYFKMLNLPTRSKVLKEKIVYKGRNFTQGRDGYFRATDGDRRRLHRLVWLDAGNKELEPDECLIFVDGNKKNFELSNLKVIKTSDFIKEQGFKGNQYVKISQGEVTEIINDLRLSYTDEELLNFKRFQDFFNAEDIRNAYEPNWEDEKFKMIPTLKHCWKKVRLQIAEEFLNGGNNNG